MAMIKLTKTAVETAQAQAQAVELRDTVVPGLLCKITPASRRVFMLQYRTIAGERRKAALGQFGELTVEQVRVLAQDWLAEVRRGGSPGAAKAAARKAQTMEEYCHAFLEDCSKERNKASTQRGYLGVIDRNIIPIMGRMKVQDVKRPNVAVLMKKLAYKPAKHLTHGEHDGGWKRVLKAASVPHVGTHGIRHRSTTDIANLGVPTKVCMALTGHKTVAMFMHYIHTEDEPVRNAAGLVASRRRAITGARQHQPQEVAA